MLTTQESKTQLAKLLATENLIVEHKNVPTAMFNTKERKLIVPILKDELTPEMYDLFIGHEVGHALNTPAEGWHDSIIDLKIPRSILNVVEDARIEKLIKRKYPGLRASFSKAYRELVSRNFFQTKGVDLNAMNILDRLNMHFKGGASQGIKFNAEEMVIVREMEELETFEDVVILSQKIMDMYRQEKKKQQEKRASDGEGEEGEEMSDENDSEEFPEFDDWNDAEESELEEEQPKSGDPSANNEELESKNDEDAEDNNIDDKIESHTDDAFRKNEKELISSNGTDYVYGNIPESIDLKKIIVPFKHIIERHKKSIWCHDANPATFNEFRAKSGKVVSYLVKEFELRKNADQMKRASVAKTGELNMSKIYSYKFNDDIFKRLTVVPGGKSHGLVMFMDWSGSMSDNLHQTIKQLLNLVLFCKKVSIPFEVYAFTNRFYDENFAGGGGRFDSYTAVNYKEDDVVLKRVNLLNLFSSKMNSSELTYMASALLKGSYNPSGRKHFSPDFPDWLGMHYTPLNEAIFCAIKIIPEFQKEYKLQIVNTVFLTDGEGHQLHRKFKSDEDQYHHFGSSGRVRAILRHVKSGTSEKIEDSSSESYTKAALKILKEVTNTNVIGFYLLDKRDSRHVISRLYPATANKELLRSTFMKEKSIVCTTGGYDEYYLIRAETDVDDDGELEVKSNSTRSFVSAFTKYNTGKIVNRTVLNKFIGLIA
jgi:hypothetical protein